MSADVAPFTVAVVVEALATTEFLFRNSSAHDLGGAFLGDAGAVSAGCEPCDEVVSSCCFVSGSCTCCTPSIEGWWLFDVDGGEVTPAPGRLGRLGITGTTGLVGARFL